MKTGDKTCGRFEPLLEACRDGELPPEAAGELRTHLESCPRCRAADREDREVASRLASLAREAGEGGEVSLWPAIRDRLLEEKGAFQPRKPGLRLLSLRPAWVGLGLSAAAAALVVFFSGLLAPGRLPENYCRIESISAPEHNLVIHRGETDGLTIIWLME